MLHRLSALALSCVVALGASCSSSSSSPPGTPAPPSQTTTTATTASSTMTPAATLVGQPAPDFTLKDLDGRDVALKSFAGKTVVLEWFNPECPYVKAAHGKGSLVSLASQWQAQGVVWLAINSGAPGKQGHDPDKNRAAKADWKLEHPILRDDSGDVGRRYGATNTPHLYVINGAGVVVYQGAIDNSRDGEGQSPEGGTLINHVDAALKDLAAGRPVAVSSTKAYGCSVKY